MSLYYCSRAGCPQRWKNFSRPRSTGATCPGCGLDATPLKPVPEGVGAFVLKDFPEHYNPSFGCVVKSRQHHRQLQKQHGAQDWEPVRESPMLSRLRKEGRL